MAARTQAGLEKQLRTLRQSLEREKAKSAGLETKLDDALERQSATAEILRVIRSSPADLQPVYDAIVRSATRLCEAKDAVIWCIDGDVLRVAAHHGALPFEDLPMVRGTPPGRAALERKTVHVLDVQAERRKYPAGSGAARRLGVRTTLSVPLLEKGQAIGVITLRRAEVQRFTAKQIELLKTFADQAVIAIENVRLFNETKESLERQTATAEILKVISRSPTDVQPVFDAIVKSALRLLGGFSAVVTRVAGDTLHLAAFTTTSDSGDEALKSLFPIPSSRGLAGKAIRTGAPAYVSDTESDPETLPALRELARARGFRSMVAAPMIREGVVVGTIHVTRREPGPFSGHQLDLLQIFADQAVIAIENVRLFNETKEALERQTATGEILASMSGSITDTKPVFDAIVRNLLRLFGTRFAAVVLLRDGKLELAGIEGDRGYERLAERFPVPLDERTIIGRVVLAGHVMQFAPMVGNPAAPPASEQFAREFGFNAQIAAPMIREGRVIGAIVTAQRDAVPFNGKQVALLTSFADQAVIAIENVRLFNETREALERQTATAEILRVISSSPTDVTPVFETILENAVRLCGSPRAAVFRFDGRLVHLVATRNWTTEAHYEMAREYPQPPNPDRLSGRTILTATIAHIEDALADPSYSSSRAHAGGWRRMLGIPILRDGVPVGAINLTWPDAGKTPQREIDILRTFADQAVIAIENVRLFNETKEALERQTATAGILRVISGSMTDTQPVFDAIARSCLALFRGSRVALGLVRGDRIEYHARVTESGTSTGPDHIPIDLGYGTGRCVIESRLIHVPDFSDAGEELSRANKEFFLHLGYRSGLFVPLMKEGRAIGAISVLRPAHGAFSDKEIALLATFADQAVIAIENVRLFNELQARNQALTVSLDRQTATAEILRVISRSQTDVQPVFDTIAENAMRLLKAWSAIVFRFDGDLLHIGAARGALPDTEEYLRQRFPSRPRFDGFVGPCVLQRSAQRIPDCSLDPSARVRETASAGGYRAALAIPMLRDDELIGVIGVTRKEPGTFPDAEVELLKTFADQAVIAIENVRLFNETKEALERQTATAEILKVIASSPSDVQPVFDAIAGSAMRLIGGFSATVMRVAGDMVHLAALTTTSDSGDEMLRGTFPQPVSEATGNAATAIRNKSPNWIGDTETDTAIATKLQALARARGFRSTLAVPMMRGGDVIGAINVTRREPGTFSDHQIGMLKTFADQAVIAIENVRLFNETKEALERQTATGEILASMSGSMTDTKPVFDAIVRNLLRLFGTLYAGVFLVRDGTLDLVGLKGEPGFEKVAELFPRPLDDRTFVGQAILTGEVIQLTPIIGNPAAPTERFAREFGFNSALTAPMIREGKVIGAITTSHRDAVPFDDKQVALIKSFADQAVIAIENVRLFNETKEALERQTATAEILKVISSSPTDIQPVFDAIASSCLRLFSGMRVSLLLRKDDAIDRAAVAGVSEEQPSEDLFPLPLDNQSISGRAILGGELLHIPDVNSESWLGARSKEGAARIGFRGIISAPMMREGGAIGAINVARAEPGAFDDKQVALLRTFADQAVIAIENVRLFKELEARNRQVTEALEQQTATSEILKVISSSPTDVQPVFDAIVHSAVRLFEPCNSGIHILDNNFIHLRAADGPQASRAAFEEVVARVYPLPFDPSHNMASRTIAERRITEVPDTEAPGVPAPTTAVGRAIGTRSITQVPLIREGVGIGTITLNHPEPGFKLNEKQRALLQTFADQAVIAIENVRLFNETKEALERQTATAEILSVISSSPTDVQPVFDAIARSALQLIGGRSASVARRVEDMLHLAAHTATTDSGDEALRKIFPTPLTGQGVTGKAVLSGMPAYVVDIETDPAYSPSFREGARARGYRSMLAVPMIREGAAVGGIVVTRRDPGRFTDHQINLLKTFADQAVIAIENVRLFNETKEALERQTATAEILKVIASSPSDVQPVFEAIAASALKLIGGRSAVVLQRVADELHLAAFTATSASGDEALTKMFPMPLTGQGVVGKAVLGRIPAYVSDFEKDDAYSPSFREMVRARGTRSMLAVPMIREGRGVGAINVTRSEPGPFTDHQINLLKTFADQAVIAIENVRLFNETKEALERQTATAEILKVISSSPTDLQPVFDAILDKATELCDANLGALGRYDGERYEHLSHRGASPEFQRYLFNGPRVMGESTAVGRMISTRRPVHIPDIKDEPAYRSGDPARVATADLAGARTLLAVPMLKEGRVVGGIIIYRPEVRPFGEKQIELVTTFANQAVIAIENVRLFKELEARTEALTRSVGQLTALGEVGQAISSTLELEMVLKTIVSRAVQLTGLDGGSIYEYDERAEVFTLQAAENMEEELVETVRRTPVRKGDGAIGRSAVTREPTQVPDILDESYQSGRKEVLIRAGYRAVLAVPLLREDHLLGALLVNRRTPGPFAPEIVELLKTFATQSAMAIQNARLFREIAEKGHQLEVASQHKSQFLASMSHELRTPLNALLGFNEMILGDVYGEVPADMQPPLAQMQASGKHLLRLINNVLDLAKIEAGRMELALSDYSVYDTVESVRSTLRPLAADKGLDFVATVPEDIPLAYGDPGRITQCLMNLAGNSLKFTKTGKVEINVAEKGGVLTYRVADTGIGIPPDKIGSLFTEFKQTDATIASEYGGTGLGLSISKKFVEMHGGRIWVESEPGQGSTFIFEIPLRAGEGKAA